MTEITTETVNVGPEQIIVLPQLTSKKNRSLFEPISTLDIALDTRQAIDLWWQQSPGTLEELQSLTTLETSPALPKNDAAEVRDLLAKAVPLAQAANAGIEDLITGTKGIFQKIFDIYKDFIGQTDSDIAAELIGKSIAKFNSLRENLTIAEVVSQVIINTRGKNPNPNRIYQKAAQLVFREMFHQFDVAKVAAEHSIAIDVSNIIDSGKIEEQELTSGFLSEPWTGAEHHEMLILKNRLRKALKALGTDQEYKVGLNTLWRWCEGDISQDASVIGILKYADSLDLGISSDLIDAWEEAAG